MSSRPLHILVVDDESKVIESMMQIFAKDSHLTIDSATTGKEAIQLVMNAPRKYAVILLDFLMPGLNGAQVAQRFLEINSDLIVVVHSGDDTRESLKESFRAGAVDFLDKGLPAQRIREKVYSLCKKFEETIQTLDDVYTPAKNTELIQSVGLIGASDELAHVSSLIHRAAEADCPVLIYGESGTGKELIAKGIHQLSKRSRFNFVPLNMSAIHSNLFESEMFGHKKGSFTGAVSDTLGHFKTANHGTIFMDEIGEMPKDQQAKVLRVLQEKEIQPVGATKTEKIDSRFIFATNVNLETAVEEDKFRKDLFFRINVFPIFLPPLRERIKDIRPLVQHFKKKYKGNSKVILMEVIHKFEKYNWPGNIRELENEMQKLIEVIPDEKITVKHLDSKFFMSDKTNVDDLTSLPYDEFKNYTRVLEADYIKKVLSRFKSTREAAVDGFKVSESTLRGRLIALNIKP